MNITDNKYKDFRSITIQGEHLLVHKSGAVINNNDEIYEVYFRENYNNREYIILDSQEKVFVHQLVAKLWLGDLPDNHYISFKDDNYSNIQPDNLEYLPRTGTRDDIAKTHIIKNIHTQEQKEIINWSQFEDKGEWVILKTLNKDLSISYEAKKPKDEYCSHIECNKKKVNKSPHCREHRNHYRRIKTQWRKAFNNINFVEEYMELLEIVKDKSALYGVNVFLQRPEPYTQHDVPTGATLTNLLGEKDLDMSDESGMSSFSNDTYGWEND